MPPNIRVTGHQWWWEVQYLSGGVDKHFITANEIHIPVGRPMDIDLVSADVIHSFWVPSLHGKVDLVPGQVNRIRIEASEPGVHRGICAEYCGAQHAHMGLLVVADSPQAYQSWVEKQLSDGKTPRMPKSSTASRFSSPSPAVFATLCVELRPVAAWARI